MEKEKLDLLVYINRSTYRVKIIKSIGNEYKMPKDISRETELLINHVSYFLKLLANKGLVVCVNPEFKKGRMYRLTDTALELLDYVEYTRYYSTLYEKYGDKEDGSSFEDSSNDNDSPDNGE